jgi:hypothetical protein
MEMPFMLACIEHGRRRPGVLRARQRIQHFGWRQYPSRSPGFRGVIDEN